MNNSKVFFTSMIPIQSLNKLKTQKSNVRLGFLYVFFALSVMLLLLNPLESFAQNPDSSPPDPITDLIAIPGDREIHLVWTAPYHNGEVIQNYKVIMWKTGTDITTTFPNLSTTTRTIITGLTNDVSYNFKVIAKNSRGDSPDSNIVSAKPTSSATMFTPDSISDLKTTRADGKILLSWTTPYNGGTSITSYKIFYWEVGIGDIKTKTVDGQVNSAQITGLINEVPYRFKIQAINAMGHGPDSNIVSATPSKSTVAKVPNQVRGENAFGGDGQVLVTWVKPSDNGSPITNYKIIVTESGSSVFTTYTTKNTDTQTTITGLKNGVKYGFKIIAINSIGEGKASGTASATPQPRFPVEITNLRAVAGNGKVTLSWSVPDDKLSQITGYRVREYTGGSTSFEVFDLLGKSTMTTVSGLINGVSYGYSVAAVTTQGLGPNSNIVNVIPKMTQVIPGAPGAITDLKATPDNNQVKLSWSIPNNNGNSITGYHIQQFKKGDSFFITIPKTGTTPNAVITGLTNGIPYDFKVMAQNSVGLGPVSNTVSAIPGAPEAKLPIPSWIKMNAKWWSEGKISDVEYVTGIEYLVNQGIIKLK